MLKYPVVLLLLGLAGCGMKGSLELPPGPPPEPLLSKLKSATAKTPPAAPADVSTDTNTNSQ